MRLYHGTSSNFLEQIKQHGLKAPLGRLTLSTSIEESKVYADWVSSRNPGSHSIVLEYEIPESEIDRYLGTADIEEGADSVYYPLLEPVPGKFLQRVFVARERHGPYEPLEARHREVRVRQHRRRR